MIAVLVALAAAVAAPAAPAAPAAAAGACLPAPPLPPGPGSAAPFRAPDARATELNAAAKALYRQNKWEEARAQYRAALAADADFLAPRLNVACSFVRQDRFREATAEVLAIVGQAYVPWAREVLEAADLGALKARPEMQEIRSGMAAAAARWGADLEDALLFVARPRAPLRVPAEGAGVFILNPHQEVWAFLPRTGRYRQLTAEDGHVVALARAADGRSIAYVTAEKLVRGAAGALALRGLALHELALATMTTTAQARVAGDVSRVAIAARAGGGGGFVYRIEGTDTNGLFALRAEGDAAADDDGGAAPGTTAATRLSPLPERLHHGPPLVTLTGKGTGAAPATGVRFGGACGLVARPAKTADGTPALAVTGGRRKPVAIESGAGASLAGLPIP